MVFVLLAGRPAAAAAAAVEFAAVLSLATYYRPGRTARAGKKSKRAQQCRLAKTLTQMCDASWLLPKT